MIQKRITNPLHVLMMLSGTPRGTNANEHFYLGLARRIREQGGRITFYVHEKPPADVFEEFRREKARFVLRGLGRRFRLPLNLEVLYDAIVLARRLKPSILVGQYSKSGNAAAIAGKILGIPSVKVFRSTSSQFMISRGVSHIGTVHKMKQRILSRMSSKLIAVSNAVARDLEVVYGIDPRHITVLKNATSPEAYRPRRSRAEVLAELGIFKDAPVLLMVAAYRPEKGHKVLLQSFAQLTSQNPHLLLVGDGFLMKQCKLISNELGIADRIHFLGKRRDVRDLLGAANVAVLPALADPFPHFVLESMAAGLPVIASDVDGIPEMVVDGKTGILVPPGDMVALSDAIDRLIGAPGKAKELGTAGYKRVLDHFDLRQRVDQECDLYRKLAFGRPRSFLGKNNVRHHFS